VVQANSPSIGSQPCVVASFTNCRITRSELPAWKEEHNRSHRKVRARVEHTFARMKGWKILRDCRLKGDGVHYAVLGIARFHNLALAG
jgi:hypothetical protein